MTGQAVTSLDAQFARFGPKSTPDSAHFVKVCYKSMFDSAHFVQFWAKIISDKAHYDQNWTNSTLQNDKLTYFCQNSVWDSER